MEFSLTSRASILFSREFYVFDIDDFSGIVAQIYDASLDVECWSRVLASLIRIFSSQKSQIVYFKSLRDATPLIRFCGFDQDLLHRLLPRFQELTPTDLRIPPRSFKAFHCRQLVSDETFHSTEMYTRVLAPMHIEYSMFFSLDLLDGGQCSVSIMRDARSRPYNSEECEDFGRLIPHISRAATMHESLSRARTAAAAAQAVIDDLPLGLVILKDEQVIMANAAADSLLGRGDPLRRTVDGRLRATTPPAHAALGKAMRDLHDHPGDSIGVTLRAGETDQVRVILRMLDLSARGSLGVQRGAMALYLADSRQPIETPEEVLRRLFGLTEREATVLRALVQGHSATIIARQLDIGVETVKTHLQHTMQAVGVKRQVDLVRSVLSSPAWFNGPGVLAAAPSTKRLQ